MDDYLDWLFDELDHGFAMNAPLYLPAGSMLANIYPELPPAPSLIPRSDTARREEIEHE